MDSTEPVKGGFCVGPDLSMTRRRLSKLVPYLAYSRPEIPMLARTL